MGRPVAAAGSAAASGATPGSDTPGSATAVPVAVTLTVSAALYAPTQVAASLADPAGLTVYLQPLAGSEVIEIEGRAPPPAPAPGQSRIDRIELLTAPGSRGDAVHALLSLPGVSTAFSGTSAWAQPFVVTAPTAVIVLPSIRTDIGSPARSVPCTTRHAAWAAAIQSISSPPGRP